MLVALGIILFIGLVLVHEWGHFIAARRNGVEVEEFGLFFPPRAKTITKKNGTTYTLNWLPLGGFVKLKGENDADVRPGTFGAASLWVKTKILLAGVGMNLVAAFVLFTILAATGMPQVVENQFTVASDTKTLHQATITVSVTEVNEDSPADKTGLQGGDQITAIGKQGNLEKIEDVADLQAASKEYAGEEVTVQYIRNGETRQAQTTLNSEETVVASRDTDNPTGYLGVTLQEEADGLTTTRSTWSAPIVAGGLMVQFTALTFEGLGHALAGLGSIVAGTVTNNDEARKAGQTAASEQVSGPVGVFAILQRGAVLGVSFIIFVIAIVSLSLAIMNALPIPALDGGRLFVILGAKLFRKPLTKEFEELVHGIGFLVLLGLIALITVVDVKRFF